MMLPERYIYSNASAGCAYGCANAGELPAFRSYSPVFLSANHQDADTAGVDSRVRVQRRPAVQFCAEPDPKKSQSGTRGSAYVGRVLAQPGGKHQRIYSAQYRNHPANGYLQAMHKDVKCQFRSLVTSLNRRQDFAHVAGKPGDSQQTRLVVQHLVDLLTVKPALAHEEDQNSGIHGARTRSHHQSIQRRKSHRSINAAAAVNCSQRASVSQMTGNQFQ